MPFSPNPLAGKSAVFGVQFYADIMAVQPLRREACRAAPKKRVYHYAVFGTAREYARFR